jgi:hypothetical protein
VLERRELVPRDRVVLRGQARRQLLAAHPLRLVAREMHGVAALGQLADDRLEVPEVREMERREEHLHDGRRAMMRRFLP